MNLERTAEAQRHFNLVTGEIPVTKMVTIITVSDEADYDMFRREDAAGE